MATRKPTIGKIASVAVRRYGRIRRQTFYYQTDGHTHPCNYYGSPVLNGWIRSHSDSPAVIRGRVFGWCHVADGTFTPYGVLQPTAEQIANNPNAIGSPSIDTRSMDARGLAYLILTDRVRCDVSSSSFTCGKPIDTDDTLAGLRVRYRGFSERFAGFAGTLTGRTCFAYAGRGSVYETVATDGSIAWISDIDFETGEPAKLEARREALHARTDARMLCGVRRPTSVRICERDYDDIRCRPEPTMQMCSDYNDHRQRQHSAAVRQRMIRLRETLARMWRDYRRAVRNPAEPGNGGSVHYAPFYVEFGRNGYDIAGDPTRRAVEAFGSL